MIFCLHYADCAGRATAILHGLYTHVISEASLNIGFSLERQKWPLYVIHKVGGGGHVAVERGGRELRIVGQG
jgi:hypothetical protein